MKAMPFLLVCCLVLAGCSDKKGDDDPEPTTSSSSSTSRAPAGLGTIEVLVNRATPNGAVPLAVNFTLDAVFRSAAGAIVPAPANATWQVLIFTANSTAHEDSFAGDQPNGTGLPADVSYNLTVPGNITFNARVDAPGYATGNASFLVLANATGGAGGAILFFEGGEGDESQWTITSNVYLDPNVGTGGEELPVPHPDGPWVITDADARTGTYSWTTPYPDSYRSRMTSVPIAIPATGATLTYYVKGGAEANNIDGLHVFVGEEGGTLESVAYHAGAIPDWTPSTVDLSDFAGKTIVLRLRFDSDLGCSSSQSPPAGCGAGYDAGGILVDDITVS